MKLKYLVRRGLAAAAALALLGLPIPTAAAGAAYGALKERVVEPQEGGPQARIVQAADAAFKNIGFLQYHYNPWGNYIYNSKYAFQWLFGFNQVYDTFDFVANCYVDTIRCKFNYGGKDWLVQLWKGSYGVCLAIGGEIGVYNKSEHFPLRHYFSAVEEDWVKMEMSIYHNGKLLFTRPFEKYWWCTGFQPGVLEWFLIKPRVHVSMVAKLEFNNTAMAQLFARCLAEKSFQHGSPTPGADSPDRYYRLGKTVALSWQRAAD
ncbi:MAG: DUF4474 domain-containing protein [Oscillospiraceae bacterium]|jgi:hypothetical protein|nr:DUF4474 domain-containing protein [Oscillospiraceae bacterium]